MPSAPSDEHERVERADRVAAATDAGDHRVDVPDLARLQLVDDLEADHALEVAHHHGIRVRPDRRAEHVERVFDALDPVAKRRCDGVGERAGALGDRHDLGAEQTHLVDVERLPADVLDAHEHRALEVHERGGGRGRDPVLAGARLGDDALLAHALGEQALAERVVDLVCARVAEVLALEVHRAETDRLGETLGLVERRDAADVVAAQVIELGLELRVTAGIFVRGGELLECGNDRLGDEAPSVGAEEAGRVGSAVDRVCRRQ